MRVDLRTASTSKFVIGATVSGLLLVAVLAISRDSLWLDEFGTWYIAQAGSPILWWRRFVAWPDSDTQIPIYHAFMYLWTKVFGTGAILMRASNVGLYVVANVALVWPFRYRPKVALVVALVTLLSAPLWYYLNELRPYIMLYAGATLMVGAAIEILTPRPQGPPTPGTVTAFCTGAVVACGATIIGILWAGAIALFVLLHWLIVRRKPLVSLLTINMVAPPIAVACIALLLAHSIHMYALGKLPALFESNSLSIIFSLYANVGLLGIGPGMLELRNFGASALQPFALDIAVGVTLLGTLATIGILDLYRRLGTTTSILVIVTLALPVLCIFVLGVALKWRVLPRHFIPLVSLVSYVYAFGILSCWRTSRMGRTIAILAVAAMAYSAVSVRFAARHARENYKEAARLAAAEIALGGTVWWIADYRGALYYNLPYIDEGIDGPTPKYARGVTFFLGSRDPAVADSGPKPTLVVYSRPESFDKVSIVKNYLARGNYRPDVSLRGFTLWRH